MKTVFGAEIGDQLLGVQTREIAGVRCAEVGIKAVQNLAKGAQEVGIGCRRVEACLVEAAQEKPGVAAGGVPEVRIQRLKELAGWPVPAEAQIAGQFFEPRQGRRQHGIDFESKCLWIHEPLLRSDCNRSASV